MCVHEWDTHLIHKPLITLLHGHFKATEIVAGADEAVLSLSYIFSLKGTHSCCYNLPVGQRESERNGQGFGSNLGPASHMAFYREYWGSAVKKKLDAVDIAG